MQQLSLVKPYHNLCAVSQKEPISPSPLQKAKTNKIAPSLQAYLEEPNFFAVHLEDESIDFKKSYYKLRVLKAAITEYEKGLSSVQKEKLKAFIKAGQSYSDALKKKLGLKKTHLFKSLITLSLAAPLEISEIPNDIFFIAQPTKIIEDDIIHPERIKNKIMENDDDAKAFNILHGFLTTFGNSCNEILFYNNEGECSKILSTAHYENPLLSDDKHLYALGLNGEFSHAIESAQKGQEYVEKHLEFFGQSPVCIAGEHSYKSSNPKDTNFTGFSRSMNIKSGRYIPSKEALLKQARKMYKRKIIGGSTVLYDVNTTHKDGKIKMELIELGTAQKLLNLPYQEA